jgi:integrase
MVERTNFLKVKAHLNYLQDVHQVGPDSVERYWFRLRLLLLWADGTPLGALASLRPTFPTYLAARPGKNGQGKLVPASQEKVIESCRRFLFWAKAVYPQELKSLALDWIQGLAPARGEIMRSPKEHVYVSVDEAIKLATLPTPPDEIALLRDRAMAAMLFCSGMRLSAAVTVPIQAVNVAERTLQQWPSLGVKTKNGKAATTYLLPIPELLQVIEAWDRVVRGHLPPTTPWYAPITHCWGEQTLTAGLEPGKNRDQALDKRLKLLYQLAGLPPKSAHKFRHGHAVYGLQHAQTMADYKAVSMNLMHENVSITDGIYAPMLANEVRDRIAALSRTSPMPPDDELSAYLSRLSREDLSKALIVIAARIAQ